jgi:asparagine synthase (glutamine-hydrolysing)
LKTHKGMKMIIAVLDKKGEDATDAVVRALKALHSEHSSGFEVATPTTCTVKKDADAMQHRSIKSVTAIGYTFPKTLPPDEPQSAKLDKATLVFTGRIYPPTQNVPAAEFVANKLKRNHNTAVEALFSEVEGDFAFIIAEPERIIAGRDPIGVQPLYYGENKSVAVLAANRKALSRMGIEKMQSFPPGHLAFVTSEGFKFKLVTSFSYPKQPKPTTIHEAAETLQKLLENSVRKRVVGLREVAVAFSGGLDSSVVAFLAKKCGVNVQLIHVSLANQHETEEAKRAADELTLPLSVHLFREEDVETAVARVVTLIEESDPIKAAVGVPFYWTAEKTAEAGFKSLLAGQGADELFGGYQRYVNEYLAHGEEHVRKTMFNDVINIHESNIERDVKICSFHDVALRLPFASCAIADFALNLPVELKLERKADSLRKLVLRKVAENMGLPASITGKSKKAVQYSTGVNDALRKIAKKQGKTTRDYVNALFLSECTLWSRNKIANTP